jgi:hypothetical protein
MPEQDTFCHPGFAAVLSFVFNGLGQIYNGQILKGLVIVLLSSLSIMVLIAGSILIAFWLLGRIGFSEALIWGSGLFFLGLTCICILGIYSILDAYRTARKK